MKRLIAYFSWSNNTKNLVEDITREIKDIDVIRIERLIPYSSDYNECAYHEAKDEVDNKIYPKIKKIDKNIKEYDEILLFFPIWWYTFPMPVGTFIKELKGYKGKVVLFANSYTNDAQYVTNSIMDFKNIDPNIKVSFGLFNKSVKEHIELLKKGE